MEEKQQNVIRNVGRAPKERTWYSVILTAALLFFTLSFSISVPLLCRQFYYAHITALNLPETTGYTYDEIREAFDQMMDFCMKGTEFGTGVMKWSADGRDHFADCAVLFRLDIHVLEISAAGLVLCALLAWMGFRAKKLLRRGPFFWAGSLLMVIFVVIAGLAATDFDRAFVIFHHLFFPGKSNWIFYTDVDQIINVLPEVFFRNCAILIVGVLFLLCILEIAADCLLSRRRQG